MEQASSKDSVKNNLNHFTNFLHIETKKPFHTTTHTL